MRQRSLLALGLAWTAALAFASPTALAKPPRAKKPAPSSAAKKPKKPPVEEPPPEVEAKPEPPPEVEAKPEPQPSVDITLDAKPEPTSAPAPQPPSAPESAPVSAEEAALGRRELRRVAAGRSLVAVWAGGGVANRRFTYNDAVGYDLAPYRLPAAPMATFGVEAYPAAASDVPVLRDLGIVAHVSRGFAFDSTTPQGATLQTSWTRFGGDLRQRLIWPGRHRFELGILVGADASYFGMSTKSRVPALLPTARTVALRFGTDVRWKLGLGVSLLAGGGYLLTTSRGEVYEHFRRPRVHGLDADLGFALDLGFGLEARLSGRYTRYFASFKPVLGDEYVAGGALDEQLQAGLGVRYAH